MALIPPQYLEAVVSIGIEIKDNNGEAQFSSIATGFVVGKANGEVNEEGKPFYRIFLVTNRHVFTTNKKTNEYLKEALLRFNTIDNKSHAFKADLLKEDGTPIWSMHENEKIDLAVLPLNPQAIIDANIEYYFFKDEDLMFAKDFKEKNVSTGDDLFVLGFPMKISGKAKNFVIVRQGIISRVDEEVLSEGFYYIDASAYPGNSGGPIIIKPEIVAIGGTTPNNRAGLIGVISSGEVYSDVAVSQQTGEAKIIFTEQTGLVRVVPVELIYEIIDGIMQVNIEEAKVEDISSELKEENDLEQSVKA